MLQPCLTQFSIVSSVGTGTAATLASLRACVSGLRPCTFETVDLATCTGTVDALDDVRLPRDFAAFDCRNNRLAELALVQDGFETAVSHAVARYGARRVGLFLGTSTSAILQAEVAYRHRDAATGMLPPGFDYERTHSVASLGTYLGQRLGIAGPSFVISCACASTAKAFGSAQRMIEAGLCDAAVVGGADTLCLTTLYGFHALGLNAPGPCRPSDVARDGISIGEAAGFALLERPRKDPDGDEIMLLGVGESNDAYHMSSPHPDGVGARLAMERALAASGLTPGDIDYINLHGTATKVGDSAEDLAVSALFGDRTPCGSTKGHTGHTLGAAGIVEAIISALAIRHGLLPGSPHTETIDPSFRSRYQLASEPARVDTVLSNSFGFGGSNCSLILGRRR
jgi:3-oxoacyl-[acyl-carrier-protein] synthase I